MITKRGSIRSAYKWGGNYIFGLILYNGIVTYLYHENIITIEMPWVPISVFGTAVAFYLGFKNNQSYDRLWEARKVWGAIVNESRSWGIDVINYVSNQFKADKLEDEELNAIKRRLIYRHLAWVYSLRRQLLEPTEWEHVSQGGTLGKHASLSQTFLGVGSVENEVKKVPLRDFLSESDYLNIRDKSNSAAQLLKQQSDDLRYLREQDLIEDFRHIELQSDLKNMYTNQGKCERIKKFPLPRQYANISTSFVFIFIILLPFTIIPQLLDHENWITWLSIPISSIIAWAYLAMESVGDYSENPFSGMPNDIPMFSICRTIEIDLKEMLGDDDIPEHVKANRGILM